MNGKKLDKIERMLTCDNAQSAKELVMDLLQRVGRINRVEAMRVGNDLIKFIAECVSLVGATPINGSPRNDFCDESFSFMDYWAQQGGQQ